MEALSSIYLFDFDDAAAAPTNGPDRVNAVSPIANEPILNSLRHYLYAFLETKTQRVPAARSCSEPNLQRKCGLWQSGDLVTGGAGALWYRAPMNMQSFEECLREAEESERLAGLARSVATRQIMTVIAFKWRRLAKLAAERKSHRRPGIQPQGVFGKPN